jgi:hypothetical protein
VSWRFPVVGVAGRSIGLRREVASPISFSARPSLPEPRLHFDGIVTLAVILEATARNA